VTVVDWQFVRTLPVNDLKDRAVALIYRPDQSARSIRSIMIKGVTRNASAIGKSEVVMIHLRKFINIFI